MKRSKRVSQRRSKRSKRVYRRRSKRSKRVSRRRSKRSKQDPRRRSKRSKQVSRRRSKRSKQDSRRRSKRSKQDSQRRSKRSKRVSRRRSKRSKRVSRRNIKKMNINLKKQPNLNKMSFIDSDSDFGLVVDQTSIGNMYLKHRNVITFNGFEKSLITSALQKYIRRQEFKKAAWCVMELDYFKKLYDPKNMKEYLEKYPDRNEKNTLSLVKGIQTNTVNRLRVICVEDVGIAQPGVCNIVNDLILKWEKSKREDANCLIEIVRILCSSRKLRFISDLKSVFNLPPYYGEGSEGVRIKNFIVKLRNYYNIPQPTGDENMNTDNISVFYWISEHMDEINYKHKIWDILKNRSKPAFVDEINVLQEWFKKGQPAKETPLYFYQAVLLSIMPELNIDKINLINLEYPVSTNETISLFKVDDYCNDKHVMFSGEKSVARFAQEGAFCINEATDILNKNYRNLYIHLKLAIDTKKNLTDKELFELMNTPVVEEEKIPETNLNKENETYYNFIVRAQPTTSSSKADAYFVDDPETGDFLLLKGPLKTTDDAENAIIMNEWKKNNGLPHMPSMSIKMLYPDRWPEGIVDCCGATARCRCVSLC